MTVLSYIETVIESIRNKSMEHFYSEIDCIICKDNDRSKYIY